ncbi:hypothetical protein DL766_008711 [Monosporascus sp. MC13-8B]|uniref:Uncharacterized protein n=1 Tax=Monosporascus cannonballus TaxID=155416 RepID=A0ABY0H6W8_9PEZI|nr:hypothetical protein DL762_005099 [Monosporascus cannonballus]RYP18256.1 hypothetical protein DL766_008711 [Monosporascus sp. MC13-8B]
MRLHYNLGSAKVYAEHPMGPLPSDIQDLCGCKANALDDVPPEPASPTSLIGDDDPVATDSSNESNGGTSPDPFYIRLEGRRQCDTILRQTDIATDSTEKIRNAATTLHIQLEDRDVEIAKLKARICKLESDALQEHKAIEICKILFGDLDLDAIRSLLDNPSFKIVIMGGAVAFRKTWSPEDNSDSVTEEEDALNIIPGERECNFGSHNVKSGNPKIEQK